MAVFGPAPTYLTTLGLIGAPWSPLAIYFQQLHVFFRTSSILTGNFLVW
jgi:hypothetical protein